MSNGIASIFALGLVSAALLAAVSINGCDTGIARLPATQARIDAPQNPPPGIRYRMDPVRNRMWMLTPEGVFLYDVRTQKAIIEVALPSWQWVDAPYGCPPDLALGPNGEAVVTSNVVPTLWRIDPDSLTVSTHELVLDADHTKDVGFSGLEYSSEQGVFVAVSDIHGSLWRIDALLRKGEKVPLSTPIRDAASCLKPQPLGA